MDQLSHPLRQGYVFDGFFDISRDEYGKPTALPSASRGSKNLGFTLKFDLEMAEKSVPFRKSHAIPGG
jgi:hypothetical protein